MRYGYGDKSTTTNELFFFVFGVSVGVIAALLLAPHSGEETRQYLRERVDEGRDRAGDILEKGKEFVERGRDTIGETIGYGRKNFQENV